MDDLDLDTLQQSGSNIYSQASLSAVLIVMKAVQQNTNKDAHQHTHQLVI